MKKIFIVIRLILHFVIANTIGRIVYSSKVFKGKHFKSIKSPGWGWISQCIWYQKILGYNRYIKFPVNFRSVVSSNNIEFDPDDLNNFQHFGCYYQNLEGKIIIGKGTYIAPNVGIITQNHDINNLDKHIKAKDIILGKNCWIGMNAMILPGVKLGNNTIVGAGSVVTKSFEGDCIIAGNPAKKIKDIEKDNS